MGAQVQAQVPGQALGDLVGLQRGQVAQGGAGAMGAAVLEPAVGAVDDLHRLTDAEGHILRRIQQVATALGPVAAEAVGVVQQIAEGLVQVLAGVGALPVAGDGQVEDQGADAPGRAQPPAQLQQAPGRLAEGLGVEVDGAEAVAAGLLGLKPPHQLPAQRGLALAADAVEDQQPVLVRRQVGAGLVEPGLGLVAIGEDAVGLGLVAGGEELGFMFGLQHVDLRSRVRGWPESGGLGPRRRAYALTISR